MQDTKNSGKPVPNKILIKLQQITNMVIPVECHSLRFVDTDCKGKLYRILLSYSYIHVL